MARRLIKDKKFVVLVIIFIAALTALGVFNLYLFLQKNETMVSAFLRNRPARLSVIKIVDSSCVDCFDVVRIIDRIKQLNVVIKNEKTIEQTSEEAQKLIAEYQITRLPTIIVTGDLEKNNDLILFWSNLGTRPNKETFIFTRVFPPYIIPVTGEVRGRITVSYLADLTCIECYDVTRHDIALANLGVMVGANNSRVLEVKSTEAQELIKKYDIMHVPTVVLEGDLGEYAALSRIWNTVGTVEDDGAYVFREDGLKLMGVYKNMRTGELGNKR